MPDAKKIGDARLAQRVIEAYADLDGLTREECAKLLPEEPAHYCGVIVDALGKGAEGEVTFDERAYLEKVGLAKEFVDGIAGSDGKRALRERVKWLGDHCVTKWWRKDENESVRAKMIEELGEIGPAAAAAVPALIELLSGGDYDFIVRAEKALARIGSAAVPSLIKLFGNKALYVRHSAARVLREIGPAAAPAVPALIEALKDRGMEREAAEALEKIGPNANAKAAVPALIRIVQRREGSAWFASDALVGIGQVTDEVVDALLASVSVTGFVSGSGSYTFDAHDMLVKMCERDGAMIFKILEAVVAPNQMAADRVLASLGGEAAPYLTQALLDGRHHVHAAAARALEKNWKIQPYAVPLLQGIVDIDSDPNCKQAAERALESVLRLVK